MTTSWRDRIDPELTGSYRGVEFRVARADTVGGRRWLVHEYPRRDQPYTEDMGRRAREWKLELFVAGDDYDVRRDDLIEALDAPGAAPLVHPYLGTVSAVASDVRWIESTQSGGMCRFQVTFHESGLERLPVRTTDTSMLVGEAATALERSLLEDFARNFSVQGLTGWSLVAAERDLRAVMRGLEDAVGNITDGIAAAIRTPGNLVALVLGGFSRLRHAVTEPQRALLGLTSLVSSGANAGGGNVSIGGGGGNGAGDSGNGGISIGNGGAILTAAPPARAIRQIVDVGFSAEGVTRPIPDTPARRARNRNTEALRHLNGRAAIVEASRLAAETDWAGWYSRDEALEASDAILELIDRQVSADSIDDRVYADLVTLRMRVTDDMRERATALPNLATWTPGATLPALVVAQRLYQDARRADEIALRNRVRHPGALRGGVGLEVLGE